MFIDPSIDCSVPIHQVLCDTGSSILIPRRLESSLLLAMVSRPPSGSRQRESGGGLDVSVNHVVLVGHSGFFFFGGDLTYEKL
jgi:hypothetical protein